MWETPAFLDSWKMFDNDYDVLYQMIKDEKLENNLTILENFAPKKLEETKRIAALIKNKITIK